MLVYSPYRWWAIIMVPNKKLSILLALNLLLIMRKLLVYNMTWLSTQFLQTPPSKLKFLMFYFLPSLTLNVAPTYFKWGPRLKYVNGVSMYFDKWVSNVSKLCLAFKKLPLCFEQGAPEARWFWTCSFPHGTSIRQTKPCFTYIFMQPVVFRPNFST